MNKKLLLPILGLVLFLLVPNPVMGQVLNNGYYNQPKLTYIEAHYNIQTCDAAFQYKFLCDRLDVIIQQNDQIVTNEDTIISQNSQLVRLANAEVCMTGYSSHGNFNDYAAYFGVNCNIGKKYSKPQLFIFII